jgi:hypothetical protein
MGQGPASLVRIVVISLRLVPWAVQSRPSNDGFGCTAAFSLRTGDERVLD